MNSFTGPQFTGPAPTGWLLGQDTHLPSTLRRSELRVSLVIERVFNAFGLLDRELVPGRSPLAAAGMARSRALGARPAPAAVSVWSFPASRRRLWRCGSFSGGPRRRPRWVIRPGPPSPALPGPADPPRQPAPQGTPVWLALFTNIHGAPAASPCRLTTAQHLKSPIRP